MSYQKLRMWQERLDRNETQYDGELSRMDARKRQYGGDKDIRPMVKLERMRKTPHVRNISAELIEAQVNSSIPQPKVTPRREKDEKLAKIIEDMLRNELDRMPFEQINDIMERTVPIQGGGVYLLEWDNTMRSHTTIGELTISALHPKQVIPQDGVYTGIEDMDYIFLKVPQTKEYILRRYGVDVSRETESDPDVKSADGETAAEDMVTQIMAFYRNDAGGIGLYSWVDDTELEDLEDYQARRLRRCKVCGAVEPMDAQPSENRVMENGILPGMPGMPDMEDMEEDPEEEADSPEQLGVVEERAAAMGGGRTVCPYCGSIEWEDAEEDFQEVWLDIRKSDGTVIPGMHMEPVVSETEVDENGLPLVLNHQVPTKVPYYKPNIYPVILQKNVSVYGKFLGDSDLDKIESQQNTTNRIEAKIIEKLVKSGSYITLPDEASIRVDSEDMKIIRPGSAASKAMIDVYNMQASIEYDMVYLNQVYEEARQEIGITDSFQGRKDTTATSGKAKEFAAAQSAGRLESKRVMKDAAYDDPTYTELSNREDQILDNWDSENRSLSRKAKNELTRALKENGYDGVILQNDRGSFGRSVTAYIALDPEQVKLTSNKKPTEDPDIRFSIGYDSDWRSLSADQQSYFQDSVARDESGRLMVLYHGSASPLFTEFNTDNGVWMTPEESYARNYADIYDSPYADTAALTGMEREIYMPLQRQRMYEVYADLRNVANLGEINGVLDEAKLQEIARESGADIDILRMIAEPYMGGEVYEMTRSRDFIDAMRDAGFDGMYAEEDGVPAFCAIGGPEQVKLTSNKNPSGSADIRYSVDEEAAPEPQAAQDQDQAAEVDVISTLPKKAQAYLQSAERRMVNAIGNAMNVPYRAKRDFLQEAARKISVEYLKEGKITQETMDSTFEQAYESGRVVDDEFYRQYKDLKEYLRTVPVTISQEDASDIADYNDFRKSTFGSLRITNEGGTPVDIVYEELRTMAPELFPGRITHPADQLVRMFDVAKSIQRSEKNLDEYYGENAQEFKRWAKNEFETAVSNGLSALRDVKRYTEDRARKSSFEPSNLTKDEVMKLYEDLKQKRKDQEKVQAKNLLTAEDEKHVNELLKGMITPEALNPETSNVKGILEVFKAKEAYEEVAKKLRSWNAERRGKLNDQADEILQTANDWKDKRAGILYSRETMERNIRDIVPDKDLAEKIITTYFAPVHKAAADANRLKNRMRGKVKELGLSQKVSGNNEVSEAHAVQLLGEAEDNIRVLENSRGRTATRDGKTLEDWKAVVDDLWNNNPDLDQNKIREAVGEFRKIYDELFQQMNDARVRNGYEPINYRKGYFPHFQPGNGDGILDAFGRALGISTEVTALPTTINGLTHTFKPGIRYMGNALERLGFNTAYDAVEGFDRYIEGAADVIYQTDNIQRLRALARQARYRTGDEGIRKQVDDVLADTRLTEAEKTDKIDKIYENGRFTLSNFVVELDEYTNLLANKKSRYDRSMEYQAGRASYNLMKSLSGRVAANMVAVNPASWLTNFIPLTQGGAMVGNRELLTGMWNTLKAYKENDGFVDRSTFLTNRRGSDPLVRAWSEQMSAIASQPMTWIDSFVADSLVRARYSQNLKNGLSEQAAMDEADQWVAGVMADRSKGSTPTLFQRNNPLTKLFTQFQLEVNNQLSYVAKDMPREYKEKGKKVLAAALLKFALGAFLFDELYEFFIGRRPALDPIGILNDTAGDLTGYELPNLVSLGTGLLTGDVPDFETERANGYETVANLAGNILESTPFVGSLLGGGRLPISNALPDAANLANAAFNGELPWNKRLSTAAKELGNPLTYLALPFGGGQLKKVFQGVKAVAQGGRYSIDSSGEKILQYPVYNDSITDAVGNLLTGTIFGVTSTEGGKDWIESDFKSLNAAQTETYLAMQELGVDGRTAFDLITTVRDAGKTGEGSTAQLQRKALYDSDAPGIAKAAVFYGMLAADSDKEVMDQLDDMGADMGSVAYALMKIKDADLMKGAQASNAKRDAIKAAVLTDDEKAEIYRQKISDSRDEDIAAFESAGLSFDDFLEAQTAYTTINEDYEGASRKALEFSRWVNQQDFTADQAAVVKDSFAYYSMVPQSGSYYDKLIGSGLDDEAAYQISSAMEDLEPEDGEDSVSKMQRYKAITESGISAEDQMAAMAAVMTESEYSKLQAGYAAGVMPESYIRFKELLPEYDADGNGSFKQEEVEAAIRAIPGLSNAQRAALWQMQNKSWKPSGNPFSTSVSQRVYNDLQSAGAELPTETTADGGIMLPMA